MIPTRWSCRRRPLEAHTTQLTEASQFKLRGLKAKAGVDAWHTVIDALLADGIQQEIAERTPIYSSLAASNRLQPAAACGRICIR
jgi:hypothetical protein